ncbi:MAG: aminofutalosine synthase MqnE [Actinomycetota bacterium]
MNALGEIAEKVYSRDRLTKEDGLLLFKENNLLFLGELARWIKNNKSSNYAFFNVNRHINLTNVCVSRCKFCAFSRDKDEPGAYTMSIDDVLEAALSAKPLGITELHIVSALHPDLPFSYYLEVVSELKRALPHVHLQAFTAVEIDYFSKITGLSIEEILLKLKQAGLGSLPGGGAEIFSFRVRERVCPKKASADEWLNVMRTAHKLGLKSNATMLYGHIETAEETIDHLLRLRALQDETSDFQSFIPLPFHPMNTQLNHYRRPTAFENLKIITISRLMLDNFDHIKAFWIMLGLKTAQLSLHFGVDDLDGTVVEEKITHAAGAETGEAIEKEDLLQLIREAGLRPVQRDTLYNILKIYDSQEMRV